MDANSQQPQRLALGASILATAVATTALLGWIVGLDALKGFGGPITMKARLRSS